MADSIKIRVDLDPKSVKKSEDEIKRSSKKLGEEIDKNVSGGILSSFKKISGAFAGLLAVKQAVSAFSQFETALAEVATITDAVDTNSKEFQKTLINLSAQFGTSAQEQVKSYYQIISSGVTDAAEANKLLISANKLAVGGLTSTETAVNLLTSAVNVYSKEGLKAAEASDIIFTTVKLGKTTVEELGQSLGLILPSAQSLGVSFSEVAGTLAQLTTKGISTSIAVTQLNAVFTAVLSKQETARSLGPEVAKAFTLQALKAKGLTGFLKDLNIALDGSKENLQKLIGSAEGAKAITALGADGFAGMADKISQLGNSAGAADAAFKIISETFSFQLMVAISSLTGLIIQLVSTVGSSFVGALQLLNTGLAFLSKNIDFLVLKIKSIALTFVVAAAGMKLFAITSVLLSKLPALFSIIKAQVQGLRIAIAILGGSGAANIALLGIKAKVASIGVKVLRVAFKLLSATMSLGILFILDEIITKFMLFKEAGMSTSKALKTAFQVTFLEIQKFAVEAFGGIFKQVAKLSILPQKLKDIANEIAIAQAEIAGGLAEKIKVLTGGDKPSGFLPLTGEDVANQKALFAELVAGMNTASTGIATASEAAFKAADESLKTLMPRAVSAGMKAVGKALVEGKNGFEAFGKAVLSIIGDMLIQIGEAIILEALAIEALRNSLTTLFGGAGLVAGAALVAFGSALKSLGGSGLGSVAPGTGSAQEPPGGSEQAADELANSLEPQRPDVRLIVQGNVLDRRETGLELIDVINEVAGTNGARIIG